MPDGGEKSVWTGNCVPKSGKNWEFPAELSDEPLMEFIPAM